MPTFRVEITPMGKPRMTQRDKWLNPPRPCIADYRAYEQIVGLTANTKNFQLPDSGFTMRFYFPTDKVARWGKAHQNKPDLDNCIKAVFDILREEDQKVCGFRACKFWAKVGALEIEVPEGKVDFWGESLFR